MVKKMLYIFLVCTLLAMPVLSYAKSCVSSSSAHHEEMMTMDDCHGMMSFAECSHLDVDIIMPQSSSSKLIPAETAQVDDFAPASITVFNIGKTPAPRAPPRYYQQAVPRTHSLSLTQRFRI